LRIHDDLFRGEFDRPEVAAERRMSRGWWLLRHHRPEAAAEDLAAAAPHANERHIFGWLAGWAAGETGHAVAPAPGRAR